MKIAIPTRDSKVDNHFGHCAYYTIVEVDDEKNVVSTSTMASPEGCGCKSNIASEMQQMGITLMLAGSIGAGAIGKLGSCGIEVIKGCAGDVNDLVKAYLAGEVVDNAQMCDHHDCSHHHHDDAPFQLDIDIK